MGERRNVVVLGFNVVVMVSLCGFFLVEFCLFVFGFWDFFVEMTGQLRNDWPVNKQKVCTGGKGIAYFYLLSESTWYNDFEVCN